MSRGPVEPIDLPEPNRRAILAGAISGDRSDHFVEISHLTYRYDAESALEDVSFSVARNSTCAVLGPSGCGKTTLCYCIAGLLPAQSGIVRVGNTALPGVRREVGVVLQDGGLLPWKTIEENVALGLLARGVHGRDEIAGRVGAALADVEIASQRLKFPDQLSGGQRQRAALARTIVLEPELLILDEASASLDAITRERMQDLLLGLYRDLRFTLIVVTHSIEEAVFLGATIVVMKKAKIQEIIQNPEFGAVGRRRAKEYFEMCALVRAVLEQE